MARRILKFWVLTIAVVIASALYRPLHVKPPVNEACGFPPMTGKCRAIVERYYFDPNLNVCRTFGYSGCNGNANNFETQDLCERACQDDKICSRVGCFIKACTKQTCPKYPVATCFAVCECESLWILDGRDVTSDCGSDDGYYKMTK